MNLILTFHRIDFHRLKTFVEKITHANILHAINHNDNEDSDAVDSWVQDEKYFMKG